MPQQLDYGQQPPSASTITFGILSMGCVVSLIACLFSFKFAFTNWSIFGCIALPILGFIFGILGIIFDRRGALALSALGLHLTALLLLLAIYLITA